tara:strand:- start:1652 stop:2563 length:912 start_codon:yes stop_codon:yes gene_type:complete
MLRSAYSRLLGSRRLMSTNARFDGCPPSPFLLDGKVIVVAGAGNPPHEQHGIGAMCSLVLARQGATVISVSRSDNCEHVTRAVEAEGTLRGGMSLRADCTTSSGVQKLADTVMAKYGRVDTIINAGIHSALPMGWGKMTEEKWMEAIDMNLHSQFHLIHKFVPILEKQREGNFLYITTIASSMGLGNGVQRHAYAAGKSAAATLTRRIGLEYSTKGVRGNVLAVGYTSGPLVDRAVAKVIAAGKKTSIDEVTQKRDSYVPRQRQTTPEEIANVAAFMVSDAASSLNAAEIFADGGTHNCAAGP